MAADAGSNMASGRDLDAGHLNQQLQPHQGFASAVGMYGCEAAVMAGVHGLQHVEGFAPAAFAHNDPVGPHAQRVADQGTSARAR